MKSLPLKTLSLKTLSLKALPLKSLSLLAALLLAPAPVFASSLPRLDDEDDKKKEGDAEEKKADEDEGPSWFAIVGGDVHPGTGGVLRGATVLAKDGKIHEIGYDLFLPEGTELLDARGLRVYPGLVALGASGRLSQGLFAAELPEEGEPVEDRWAVQEEDDPWWLAEEVQDPAASVDLGEEPIPAGGWDRHLDSVGPDDSQAAELLESFNPASLQQGLAKGKRPSLEDGFDTFNSFLVLALATGITSAEQSNTAVKLRRGEIDGVVMNEGPMASLSWSVSNPGSIRSLKEKFQRAAEYIREYRAWEARKDKDEKEPAKKGVDSNALRVLLGEVLPRFRANDRKDLLGIARFAQTYGFRPVIEGCREGWTVADELGRAGAYAILSARDRLPKNEALVRPGGSSIENAARLHAAGVQVAIRPQNTSIDFIGITGRDLLHLPVEAGFAVRGGLSPQAALEAITTVPARLLGVGHRIGSLEVGKDLDAIVTDGDLLHYKTFVQYSVVHGELVYDKEEELYYAHIRPRPEREPLVPSADEEEVEESESESEDAEGEADADTEKKDEEKDEDEGDEGDED